jgi:hypothetical protein
LSLVSRGKAGQEPADEQFQVGFTAHYSTDGPVHGMADWRLKGAIAPTLRFSPPLLQIGTMSERQFAVEPATRIQANESIVAIDCQAPSGWSVAVTREQGSPPGQFTAIVRRKPEGQRGPVADVIRFTPIDRAGKRLPVKEMKMVGEVVPDVLGHPREIHHGRQPCGATAEETIRLVSLTKRPFRVTSARSRSADLKVTRIPDNDGGWLYSLQVRLTAMGEQETLAVFTVQEEDAEEFEVAVPVRYHGFQGP